MSEQQVPIPPVNPSNPSEREQAFAADLANLAEQVEKQTLGNSVRILEDVLSHTTATPKEFGTGTGWVRRGTIGDGPSTLTVKEEKVPDDAGYKRSLGATMEDKHYDLDPNTGKGHITEWTEIAKGARAGRTREMEPKDYFDLLGHVSDALRSNDTVRTPRPERGLGNIMLKAFGVTNRRVPFRTAYHTGPIPKRYRS